jgi:hypothetical protein
MRSALLLSDLRAPETFPSPHSSSHPNDGVYALDKRPGALQAACDQLAPACNAADLAYRK